MDTNLISYYNTLFNADERVCFAWQSNDTAIIPLTSWTEQRSPWLSVNPIDGECDNDPESSILPWARATLPRRADCNVIAFRNFLIEMDKVPLQEQIGIIRDCKMPFTTSVFSGKKSIHFIISLTDPCIDKEEYILLAETIHRAIPAKVDTACKNPSRLTRNPGVIRKDTGKEQKLIEVRNRIVKQEVIDWAASRGVTPQVKPVKEQKINSTKIPEAWVTKFLLTGAAVGTRNEKAFKVACSLARSGFSESEATQLMIWVPGLCVNMKEQNEIIKTVHSAYQKVK